MGNRSFGGRLGVDSVMKQVVNKKFKQSREKGGQSNLKQDPQEREEKRQVMKTLQTQKLKTSCWLGRRAQQRAESKANSEVVSLIHWVSIIEKTGSTEQQRDWWGEGREGQPFRT